MKKLECIDICKGIAILLVILGHVPRDSMRYSFFIIDYVWNFIYIFHMPLFFLISGFLFEYTKNKNYSNSKFLTKKIKTILVPWISFEIIVYFVMIMISWVPLTHELGNNMFETMGFSKYIYYSVLTCIIHMQYIYGIYWFCSVQK